VKWSKDISEDIEVTIADLRGSVHVADSASPHAGKVIVTIAVSSSLGNKSFTMLLENSSLSPEDQQAFKQNWVTLVDDLLSNAGFIETE
jgi:hypothetical protein